MRAYCVPSIVQKVFTYIALFNPQKISRFWKPTQRISTIRL